jgi:crotonobetainyl-CoA:carnitine CoA-transferase CaiB-like acyl-CoA transferase
MLTYVAAWNLNGDFVPERMKNSAHPSIVPFQNFEAADGWIVVACAMEKFWKRLAVAIGHPDLADDERYLTFADRSRNSDELIKILAEIFLTQKCDYWITALTDAGVPVGPIYDVDHALKDPHTLARGLVVETDHHRFGRVRQVASPVNFGSMPKEYRRAPQRNEDFGYVMNELLKYSPEQIAVLVSAGAFGVNSVAQSSSENLEAESTL